MKLYDGVLLIRYGHLGDVVMCTSVVQFALDSLSLDGRVSLVTKESYFGLFEGNSKIDLYPWSEGDKDREILADKLSNRNFALCIDLQNSDLSEIFTTGVGARETIKFRREIQELDRRLASFGRIVYDSVSQLEMLGATVANLGMSGWSLPQTQVWCAGGAGMEGINEWDVALCPGSRSPLKSWPVEGWIQLSSSLRNLGYTLVFVGGASEQALVSRVIEELGEEIMSTCGCTVGEMARVLRKCAISVSVDSGPMHLSNACGVATVGLFGPTSERRFGTLNVHNEVGRCEFHPCSNYGEGCCLLNERSCMNDIRANRVSKALLPLLRSRAQ